MDELCPCPRPVVSAQTGTLLRWEEDSGQLFHNRSAVPVSRAISPPISHSLIYIYYNAGQHYLGPHQRDVMLLIAVLSQYYRPRAYIHAAVYCRNPRPRPMSCYMCSVVRELRLIIEYTRGHPRTLSPTRSAASLTRTFDLRLTFNHLFFPSHIHKDTQLTN